MPAKFKPSERVYAKNARGARMSTQPRSKTFKHYYLKNTPKEDYLRQSTVAELSQSTNRSS